jgi:hypothetical protein
METCANGRELFSLVAGLTFFDPRVFFNRFSLAIVSSHLWRPDCYAIRARRIFFMIRPKRMGSEEKTYTRNGAIRVKLLTV